jgi:hypothetical protein
MTARLGLCWHPLLRLAVTVEADYAAVPVPLKNPPLGQFREQEMRNAARCQSVCDKRFKLRTILYQYSDQSSTIWAKSRKFVAVHGNLLGDDRRSRSTSQ